MKKSDWALIILIVTVVGVISWFVIGSILPEPENESVKIVPEITSSIEVPANNVMLYDTDRPSWCPHDFSVAEENTNEENQESNGTSGGSGDQENNANGEGRQAINASFNSCAINSSFTTVTYGD